MTSRLSRRSLFGLGLGRLVEERLGALDLIDRTEPGDPPPPEADDSSSHRKDATRRAWGEGDSRPLLARLEPAAAHLLEVCGVEAGHRLLDVGAGDGNLALAAASAGAEVTAADLSPVLVERGRDRARAARAKVEWDVADVEALPYADASFDCVASNFGVIYVDDPRRAIAELERVVCPGGLVAITAWASSDLMGRVLRLAAEREGSARRRARPERWGRFETALLLFSQLDDFEMLDGTLRMEFASAAEMWAIFASPPGPLAGALSRGADRDELRKEFLALLGDAHRDSAAGLSVDVGYSIVLGRRQAAGPQTTFPPSEGSETDATGRSPDQPNGSPGAGALARG